MIDWKKMNADEVNFEVDAEGVQEVTGAVLFPLKVFDGSGHFLFTHPVSIRTEFYLQLKTVNDWREQLQKILRTRLREELGRRRHRAEVSIQDRLQLNTLPKFIQG